jgi:hypothetical protein
LMKWSLWVVSRIGTRNIWSKLNERTAGETDYE